VGCLPVIVVQHLPEYRSILRVAVGGGSGANPLVGLLFLREVGEGSAFGPIGLALKVGMVNWFPDVPEAFHRTTAALREAGVADGMLVGDHLSAGRLDHLVHQAG